MGKNEVFPNIEEHNTELIRRWNKKAGDCEDIAGVLLGDTMFGQGGDTLFLSFLKQMKCHRWYLLPGNHHAGYTANFTK